MRKEYEGKPVVFIAVNSGNPKSAVEGYAKSTKFEWPILVDEAGETERAFGTKISLQNIYQWFLVDPEGRSSPAGFDVTAIKAKIDGMLPQAKWFFDGVAVPAKLKPLAQEIEMGQYDPAVSILAASRDEAAKALYEKLRPLAEAMLEKAKAAEGEGRNFAAWTEYARLAAWFRKTDYEKTATAAMAELKKDKGVQEELSAKQLLDQAKALLATGRKPDRANAVGLLEALRKKHPSTEAKKEADRLIATANASK
jgi:hypothetical protein